MLLIGVLGVVVGGYALLNPLVSMMAFIFLVAFEAILLGVFLRDARLQGARRRRRASGSSTSPARCRSCSASW